MALCVASFPACSGEPTERAEPVIASDTQAQGAGAVYGPKDRDTPVKDIAVKILIFEHIGGTGDAGPPVRMRSGW